MNRGGAGARSLNIELQAALNPMSDRKIERFGWTFASGDKVMQIENDYDKEVYNGDVGYIDDVNLDDGELTANFDGRTVSYGRSLSCWSGRKRRSPSRFAMFRVDGGGQSCMGGCVQARPSQSSSTRRVKPWRQRIFCMIQTSLCPTQTSDATG
jgi:hypothetical protein